jgi:hypothetical protein
VNPVRERDRLERELTARGIALSVERTRTLHPLRS